MTSLKGFNAAPEWISKHVMGGVSPVQIAESLKILLDLGLLVKTANGFRQKDPLLTTDDEVQDILVKLYHNQMLKLASTALSELSGDKRDFSAVTFAIKRKDFPSLKKHLQLMRKELLISLQVTEKLMILFKSISSFFL